MSTEPTRALSVRPHWAWLIVHGHKTVENRSKPTAFRGTLWIHASLPVIADEYALAQVTAEENGVRLPAAADLQRGGIIGRVDIVGCCLLSDNPWHFPGYWAWELANAQTVEFTPCKGALGFFVPDILNAPVLRQPIENSTNTKDDH